MPVAPEGLQGMSTRAELFRRLGRTDEARTAFIEAVSLATTNPERRLLSGRLAEL